MKGKIEADEAVTDDGKAACHSDYVDPEQAKEIQGGEKLVQLNTAPAHNIATEDRVI
jgi:phosphomethylpyrimidine synthase